MLAAGCFGATVAAQEAKVQTMNLPPVVVLGTNLSEHEVTQRLPQAVTALSGEGLDAAGIRSVLDLQRADGLQH